MTKSIKKQYEERDNKSPFDIEWNFYNDKTPINLEVFKREIEEFVKGFNSCLFHSVKSIFVRFISYFPAVKALRFFECSFSDENFLKFKNLKLNKLEFEFCNIPEISSFCSFLKSISVKHIQLYENNFIEIYISNIVESLSFNETILKIYIYQDVRNKAIVSAIKNFLKSNKTIKHTEPSKKLEEEDIIELQEIVNSHPFILGLQVYENFIEPKGKSKMLKELVHSALQSQYEKANSLNEVPVILMGDGRTGKTSLLRNLSGKSFQKETQSTLVLEDHQIFQVHRHNFKPLTKYDLSIQRVKNMMYSKYQIEDEVQKKSKYNLAFEDELITRTVREKSFVEQYTTDYFSDFSTSDTFLRVYDFGGHEVFSSVHHIFMNKKAIYLVVFNMTKLRECDLFRLKFWCESILRNTPKVPVLLIGTYLNTFLKKNKNLENINNTIKSFLSKLSGKLTLVEDEKTIFFLLKTLLILLRVVKRQLKWSSRA
eukprot:maker-scaffold_28-snap-gene-4.91-mRNA-1 protein AED:0.14 eAED:0.14 QI:17/0.75/0.55/1/0.62/0.55/9/0/483